MELSKPTNQPKEETQELSRFEILVQISLQEATDGIIAIDHLFWRLHKTTVFEMASFHPGLGQIQIILNGGGSIPGRFSSKFVLCLQLGQEHSLQSEEVKLMLTQLVRISDLAVTLRRERFVWQTGPSTHVGWNHRAFRIRRVCGFFWICCACALGLIDIRNRNTALLFVVRTRVLLI